MIDSVGGGRVDISSTAGHTGIAEFSFYNASKHAMR